MPPKPKPKTKKELRLEAEAAARAAEEERLRQEEEARRVAAQIEEKRQQLLQEFAAQRDARLDAERQKLAPLLLHMQQQRRELAAAAGAVREWEQYLQSSPLPDPRDRPAMNDFLNTIGSMEDVEAADLHKTLQQCEACLQLAEQCLSLAAEEDMAAALHASLNALVAGPAGSTSSTTTAALVSPDTPNSTGRPETAGSSSAEVGDGAGASSVDAAAAQSESAEECVGGDAAETAAAVPAAAPASVPVSAAATWDAAAAAAASEACRTRAAQHQQDASALYDSIASLIDAATAHVLHRADEYADPKGDVLLTAQQGDLQFGLWVNTAKNPRFKLVDLAGLGMTVEIPKQLALANIALRVERRPFHALPNSSGSSSSTADSCLAPLGGVLQVELLTLPPPPTHSKAWTIRQVSPQSSSISTVPYPIPPVGADPSTWRPDEEPPPLLFSMRLQDRLLVPGAVRVGWWDASKQAWSQEGISNVSYDAASGRLAFSSTHLGCLALLQDTAAHLPYSAWTIRPTGGLGGATATIDLQVQGLPTSTDNSSSGSGDSEGSPPAATISLEVGSGWARLRGPALPQLSHLLGRPLPPWQLLSACEACGLRLSPGRRELAAVGCQDKEAAAEQAMCADLAALCTKFLVASSRWNPAAGRDVALVRLSEVADWEEGGRTSNAAAARIFSKEATEGPRRVLIARREAGSAHGVSRTDGGNSQPGPPPPQDLSTIEAVQTAMRAESAWMHASLLQLLDTDSSRRQEDGGSGGGTEDAATGSSQSQPSLSSFLQDCYDVDAGFHGSMVQLLQALHVFAF